jgi:F0F1-type ATP synthase assembly protein I
VASTYSSDGANAAPPGLVSQPDKSLGELFSTMTAELGTLVHQEIELAKVETKAEVSQAAKAGGMFAGAAFTAHMAWLFSSLALAWLLDHWMNRAFAFVIVGLLYAVIAGVLFAVGKTRLKQIDPVPHQTVETLKEDAQWAKAQKS